MTNHVCEHCKVRFQRDGDRPYMYCSRTCYHASRVGQPSVRKAKFIDRQCKECGKGFQSLSSAGARINYCSRWCQNMHSERTLPIRTLSVAEAAYLAALIDGEGTITVSDRRSSRPGSTHPSIYVSIAGTHMPMHEWLVATTGTGTITKESHDPKSLIRRNKDCYAWRVGAARAVVILRQILPYMIEKAPRAERAIRCFEQGYSAFDSPASTASAGGSLAS